jgi:hypothetical protein
MFAQTHRICVPMIALALFGIAKCPNIGNEPTLGESASAPAFELPQQAGPKGLQGNADAAGGTG